MPAYTTSVAEFFGWVIKLLYVYIWKSNSAPWEGNKIFWLLPGSSEIFPYTVYFFVLNLIHVSRSGFININLVLNWKKASQFSGEARSSSKRLSLSCSTFPSNTAVYSHVSLVTFSLQFPLPQNPTLSTWILCSASAHLVVLLAFPWHKEIHSYHKEIKMACSEAKYEWPWPGITNLRYPQFHGSCFMKSL